MKVNQINYIVVGLKQDDTILYQEIFPITISDEYNLQKTLTEMEILLSMKKGDWEKEFQITPYVRFHRKINTKGVDWTGIVFEQA